MDSLAQVSFFSVESLCCAGGSGKVQLCSPRGQDSEEEEATSHPVRMHISSSRHRSGGADHFDDIRSSGKPHKDKQRHKHGDRRDK